MESTSPCTVRYTNLTFLRRGSGQNCYSARVFCPLETLTYSGALDEMGGGVCSHRKTREPQHYF
ncbi:hypothetical protein HNQ64_000409 [Prosthecobacter dejongeii]|uniref:Uncharacterized protein n=1 Tax=Prosthecobacter dejongeii TaxID=48465 RepID=A0A7W7YH92_9BACT|nr:hypothetical protein [Prosthecobacter dejongeii]